jgi:hypothetical protein
MKSFGSVGEGRSLTVWEACHSEDGPHSTFETVNGTGGEWLVETRLQRPRIPNGRGSNRNKARNHQPVAVGGNKKEIIACLVLHHPTLGTQGG